MKQKGVFFNDIETYMIGLLCYGVLDDGYCCDAGDIGLGMGWHM